MTIAARLSFRARYALFSFWIIGLVTYSYYHRVLSESYFENDVKNHQKIASTIQNRFYMELFDLIEKYKPLERSESFQSQRNSDVCILDGNYGANDWRSFGDLSYHNLQECCHLDTEQYENLHTNHKDYVGRIRRFPKSLVSILSPREEGIVTVGGGRYSVLLLTMLEKLRETGTTLPVEVFIPPQDEGDDAFCKKFLPKFNAKCVYFKDVLPKEVLDNLKVESYQIKVMALVMSSFKKIIFLDADNYAMKNLNNILNADVFKEKGLITWPDLWRRATAPVFYQITDVEVDLTCRIRYAYDDLTPVSHYQKNVHDINATNPDSHIPFHDLNGTVADLSTESGQMLIDKTKHFNTLLLALYYNIWGPRWYYRMFSQGTAGEGDKETFISAAHVLGNPYYQVRTNIELDGLYHDTKGFQGLGLLQHDFQQDYELYKKIKVEIENNREKYTSFDRKYDLEKSYRDTFWKSNGPNRDSFIDVMFLHGSFYKCDPLDLYSNSAFMFSNGEQTRGFRGHNRYNNFDIEMFNFNIMHKYLCDRDKSKRFTDFKYFHKSVSKEDWPKVCNYLNDHIKFLKKNPL